MILHPRSGVRPAERFAQPSLSIARLDKERHVEQPGESKSRYQRHVFAWRSTPKLTTFSRDDKLCVAFITMDLRCSGNRIGTRTTLASNKYK